MEGTDYRNGAVGRTVVLDGEGLQGGAYYGDALYDPIREGGLIKCKLGKVGLGRCSAEGGRQEVGQLELLQAGTAMG